MNLSVLLIEDDPADAALVRATLRAAGLDVAWTQVGSQSELRSALQEAHYDMVLSDYNLLGFLGDHILEECRSAGLECPFIFVSGALGEEKAIDLLKRGATDYVFKGRLERLLPSIERALEEARLRQEAKQAQQQTREALAQLTASEARYKEAAERERIARQQAEDANRLKDEFLATVSHEIRTPLAAISGWIHMLRSGVLDAEDAEKAMETIDRNARAQSRLIDDLLDVSRILAGKLTIERRVVDVIRLVDETIQSVLPAAMARDIQLRASLDESAVVEGDPHRLGQVFWNLLSNAVKFSAPGGPVEVQAKSYPAFVEIAIVDHGVGIPADFLPHVFEPFRQVDGSTTRREGGLGLGLAIVQQLVDLHGGRISVSSPGPGLGATFTVRLPRLPVDTATAHAAELAHSGCRPELADLRVLVVDDEEDLRELVRMMLQACGCKVTTCASAAEAFAALQQQAHDVLVSDVGMPEEDGYSLIQRVRAAAEPARATRAVALTAYTRPEDKNRALQAGFDACLPKPFLPSDLLEVIAALRGART